MGFAGSFGKFAKGDVVNVTADCFPELGAEDGPDFLTIDNLDLGSQKLQVVNPLDNDFISGIPKASGITVNTTHGNEESIAKVTRTYHPDVETMEGAAFIHAANAFNWKALQLRAISNMVERRNKAAWDIPLATKKLNEKVIAVLTDLNK
jgi:futalosine hydrolase